jgi:hypothetical protein
MTTVETHHPIGTEEIRDTETGPIGLFDIEREYRHQDNQERSFMDESEGHLTPRASHQQDVHGYATADGTTHASPERMTESMRISVLKQSSTGVNIEITNVTVKQGKIDHFVFYTVKGTDKQGSFEVVRTSHHFQEIRAILTSRWPGSYVPALPPKRMIAKTTPNFVEQRRKQYEMFCQKLSEIPYLYYSPEFQLFLKSTSPDVSVELVRFPRADYVEIMSRLDANFGEIIQKELVSGELEKIDNFKLYLSETLPPFKRYKKILKDIVKARRSYLNQFSLLQESMCTGFESRVLKVYEDNIEPRESVKSESFVSTMSDSITKIKVNAQVDPLEFLHAWMKNEEREAVGFLHTLEQREKLVAHRDKLLEKQRSTNKTLDKIAAGSFTLKTMFSTKGREAERDIMEKQVASYNKDAELLKMLIEKVTLILARSEIDRFKKCKSEQYHQVVSVASQSEMAKLKDMTDFWGSMLKKNDQTISDV